MSATAIASIHVNIKTKVFLSDITCDKCGGDLLISSLLRESGQDYVHLDISCLDLRCISCGIKYTGTLKLERKPLPDLNQLRLPDGYYEKVSQ
jgi:hypothetical protein